MNDGSVIYKGFWIKSIINEFGNYFLYGRASESAYGDAHNIEGCKSVIDILSSIDTKITNRNK